MTNEELLKLAEVEAPDFVAGTAEVLAEISPEFEEEVLDDLKFILSTTQEKVAGMGSALLKGVIGTAVTGMGLAVATDLYSAAKRGLNKQRNWERIREANPHLFNGEHPEITPDKMRKAYDTVHRLAPEMMNDPIAGGAILYHVAPHAGEATLGLPTLEKILDLQKKSREGGGRVFEGRNDAWKDFLRHSGGRDRRAEFDE